MGSIDSLVWAVGIISRYLEPFQKPGEMQEWLNWHAWKACIPQGIEGSNPSLSANQNHGPERGHFHFWTAKACFRKAQK